jgi:hypothetical protein
VRIGTATRAGDRDPAHRDDGAALKRPRPLVARRSSPRQGSRGELIDADAAIDALYGAGLIHVCNDLVIPTRAARLMDELRL